MTKNLEQLCVRAALSAYLEAAVDYLHSGDPDITRKVLAVSIAEMRDSLNHGNEIGECDFDHAQRIADCATGLKLATQKT